MERTIIEAVAGALLSVGGFIAGKKKTDAEATKTAYDAFNVALSSLRDEIKANAERFNEVRKALEAKIDEQAERITEQAKRITELEEENRSLKIQITQFQMPSLQPTQTYLK